MCGHYEMLQARKERVVAANPHLAHKIMGTRRPEVVIYPAAPPAPPVKTYRPPALDGLIEMVAYQIDSSADSIRGLGKQRKLVNARFCIAVLAAEFNPRLSARAVDDALLRGENMTIWYRERHRDRCAMIPGYEALYNRCREAVLARRA